MSSDMPEPNVGRPAARQERPTNGLLLDSISLSLLANRQSTFGNPQFQRVCVTFLSDLGLSGLSPFTSASMAAKSWPGMMYGIGVRNSSIGEEIEIPRVANLS